MRRIAGLECRENRGVFEKLFGVHLINSQIYFIDYLPSDVNMKDVAVIACISLALAFIATLYPSWRAAKTQLRRHYAMNNNIVLKCENVGKSYNDGALNVQVLNGLNLEVSQGQSVSVIGSSGSGKSTLLHILGGLDMPSEGRVTLMGQDLGQMSQKQLGLLRNQYLGFVYQFHHLLPEFSALENVMMPLLIGKKTKAEAEAQAEVMLEKVGLKQRMLHRPSELSGGERQRAAIARALVTQPKCLLADEPTGNLDRKNAQNVLDMMLDLKNELGTSLIVVTHDDELAVRFERVMTMQDGRLQDK